jgi:hypothetical protein
MVKTQKRNKSKIRSKKTKFLRKKKIIGGVPPPPTPRTRGLMPLPPVPEIRVNHLPINNGEHASIGNNSAYASGASTTGSMYVTPASSRSGSPRPSMNNEVYQRVNNGGLNGPVPLHPPRLPSRRGNRTYEIPTIRQPPQLPFGHALV